MIKYGEVLKQLDECCDNFTFPMLDNGYVYLAGTKLHVYRADTRWVIIIEVIGFNYRGGEHNGITNSLHIYGNCLNYEPGLQNENFLHPTSDDSDCKTFDEDDGFYLNPNCNTFLLRNESAITIHNREQYIESGIVLENEDKISAIEFLRLLDEKYHNKLIATESEINDRIPSGLNRILEIDNWYHPNVIIGELPSKNETFVLISKVIETGDLELYKPTHKPNTHWINWPDGGML